MLLNIYIEIEKISSSLSKACGVDSETKNTFVTNPLFYLIEVHISRLMNSLGVRVEDGLFAKIT